MKKTISTLVLFIIANLTFSQSLCLTNTTTFTTNLSSMPNTWNTPILKDINNDGNRDAVLTSYASGYFGVALGNGNGTFGIVTKYNVTGLLTNCNCLTALSVNDINNDTKPDIVACAFDSLYIYNGNGLGAFSLVNKIKLGSYISFFYPTKILLDDFNNDSKVDIFCGDQNGTIFIMNGNNTNIFTPTLPPPSGLTSSINWFNDDFNNDGKQDIYTFKWLTTNSITAHIFYGNGNNTFQPPLNYTVYTKCNNYSYNSSCIDDFNSDGKNDIVLCGSILKNNTTNFTVFYNDTTSSIVKVSSGFFNCDNYKDLQILIKNGTHFDNRFYYGDNNFNFPANNIQEPLSPTTLDYIYSADINNDGKTDLIPTVQNQVFAILNKPACIQSSIPTNTKCQNDILVLSAPAIATNYTWQPTLANSNTINPGSSNNYYCIINYSGTICSSNTINVIVNLELVSLSGQKSMLHKS